MKRNARDITGGIVLAIASLFAGASRADVVTDWNIKADAIIAEAKIGTPPAIRIMAIAQTAVHEAVRSAAAAPAMSVDAAVAAANRATLAKLLPAQQAAIDAAYQSALAAIPDGPARHAGVAAGERAADAVLARRREDTIASESYRPAAAAGTYVPTVVPAVPTWGQRKPWLMQTPTQFRPGAPVALASDTWARDFDEVKSLGGRVSSKRTAEQTDVARFWDFSLPAIYHGVVRSVATQPGRDVTANARLLAATAQAMDDAMIGVFDAKYHYNFWRPTTAIRNADGDGNASTERDAAWLPLIDVPMHPEYPSAHGALASAVATVLKAEVGDRPLPVLTTTSATAKGAARHWTSLDDFVREVGNARVWAGIHYRRSTEVGAAMGRQIGALAAEAMQSAQH